MFDCDKVCLNIESSDLSAVLVGANCSATFDYSYGFNNPDCGGIIHSDCSCCSVDEYDFCNRPELRFHWEAYTQISDCEFNSDPASLNTEEFFESYLEL